MSHLATVHVPAASLRRAQPSRAKDSQRERRRIRRACWAIAVTWAVGLSDAHADDGLMTQMPEIVASVAAGPTEKPTDLAIIPRDAFHVLPGFRVERLFTVNKEKFGSWVAMTVDPQGRIIASDQGGQGLFRITPSPIGGREPTKVERLDAKISSAQGLLFAFDSLYVTKNGGGSGIFRLQDADGDDQFDKVTRLADIAGGGEHGPHGLRLSPDGKQIYIVAGNHTPPPIELTADPPQQMGGVRSGQRHAKIESGTCRLSPNWDEDLLLPRQWDAGGHAVGLLAPAGWIAAIDPDGKNWDLRTIGFRNAYDLALNADGELFTYDSDMEWDIGLPWYRPTRVLHATAGADHGWRAGSACWPAYRLDSLPAAVDIGPGSPVGLEFGYGTKFPAQYQRALYALDWTFGTIYAVHLKADGASYTGSREEFLSRSPLPLTDAVVGTDGALYFLTGGRSVQSELYRVTYVGSASTAPVDARDTQFAELRRIRQQAEAYVKPDEDRLQAAARLVGLLGHADRHIRYAARVALERLSPDLWKDRVLASKDPDTVIGGVVGLAHTLEPAAQPALLAALDGLDFGQMPDRQQLDALRAYALVFIRLGAPDSEVAARLAVKFDSYYPSHADLLNRELCEMLVFLKSPTVAAKTIALLMQPSSSTPAQVTNPTSQAYEAARSPHFADVMAMQTHPPDLQKISYVFSLRNLRDGWTPEDRIYYFNWLHDSQEKGDGQTFRRFLANVSQDAYDNAPEADRAAIDAAGVRRPPKPVDLPKPIGPGQAYTVDDLVALSAAHPAERNFASGKRTFAAARCWVCHRFAGEGGSAGPDLTQAAGRFTVRDLAESLVEPNKVVSDQYRATIIETKDGRTIVGRILSEYGETIAVAIDPEDATHLVHLLKSDIERRERTPNSLMPANLLGTLNPSEVLDLLAYLLSRGNPDDPMFGK
jgi:putative heme-binding domain-containing protein